MKVIIYPKEYNCVEDKLVEGSTVAVLRVSQEGLDHFDGSYEELGKCNVPELHPFKVLDQSELPDDPQFEEAWTADFTDVELKGLGYFMYHKQPRPTDVPEYTGEE